MATADPLIGFLIDKLGTCVGEYIISGFTGFKDEFEKMKRSLPFLKSFFIDLQKDKAIGRSEILKTSVVLLRELIYEAEDILLDCQIDQESNHKTPEFLRKFNHHRRKTKEKLQKINEEISNMEKKLRAYCVTNMVQRSNWLEGSSSCANERSRWTTSLPNQFGTVGLAEDVREIKRWVLQENNELQRVGIVGMGGLGKTTLAQKICNDQSTQLKKRFKKKIWVPVSEHVDMVRIMRTILDELHVKDHSADSIPGTLLKNIKDALAETTYLIIMDDVWSLEHGWWSQLLDGLTQDRKYSSCIIITTRNEEVARSMGVPELRIHRPTRLGDEDSWSLLCKVAFSSTQGICRNPELKEVGKKIAKKCGGLPLAIKAIAGLLSSKSPSLYEWQKIHEDFRVKLAEITAASDGSSVNASLQLSYDDLPSHLKQCILCCSIYPEDVIIRTEQLVYWWAGEGFVVPGNDETAIQSGYDCLYELINRCLIEPTEGRAKFSSDRFKLCKMHDMVRDMIIEVAKQEAFSSFNDGNGQIFDENTRHFGITEKSGSIQPTKNPNSKIRAMLKTYGKDTVKSKLDCFLPDVNLRVLDLSHCHIRSVKDFVGWVKPQKRLVYLNLYGSEFYGDPTIFIKYLRNLQYLAINEQQVKSVSSLPKLRLLKLNPHPRYKTPEGLANLINLEQLSGIVLGDRINIGGPGGDCSLREIINLPKLWVLEVGTTASLYMADDVLACEISVISRLRQLEVFAIELYDNRTNLLDQLAPPRSLQELRIIGGGGETTPGFIKPELLPELRHLIIQNCENLTSMSPNFWEKEKTWKLDSLSLINLPKLKVNWETLRQMMPSIKCVEIKNVLKVENFSLATFKTRFTVWRKIDEEDSISRGKPLSKKRKA